MARGKKTHEDLCAMLHANGTTRMTASALARGFGVAKRTMNYALACLREDGLIVDQWSGPTERAIMWVGPDPDRDEACSDVDSRAPVNA
jgi:DNA-binding transcriptional ArsR family regulator